jgi:hypothetical protein
MPRRARCSDVLKVTNEAARGTKPPNETATELPPMKLLENDMETPLGSDEDGTMCDGCHRLRAVTAAMR